MGDPVQFFYEGGWWDMKLDKIATDATAEENSHGYSLVSAYYEDAKHTVHTFMCFASVYCSK